MKKLIIPALVAAVVILSFFAFRPAHQEEGKDYMVVIHDLANAELFIAYSDGRTEVKKDLGSRDFQKRALEMAIAFKQINVQGYELKTSHQNPAVNLNYYIFEK